MTPRERLLSRCDVLYAEERRKDRGVVRPNPSKLIAEGIRAGRSAIEATSLDVDASRYFRALKERIEDLKAGYRSRPWSEDGDNDEDGWILGGLSTVLREVEAEEARGEG